MRVDAAHRFDAVAGGLDDYWRATELLVNTLREIETVSSQVLCGSLAKDDVIPGWSDIDLLVFLGDGGENLVTLNAIADRVQDVQGKIPVPLGLDIVSDRAFRRSGQLGGRPLMMTYEVAHYGVLLYGDWPFTTTEYGSLARDRVDQERALLIRAELHSWRRGWCRRPRGARGDATWLFETAKVLLRVLQCLTGPNLLRPMGAHVSLARLRKTEPDHPLLPAIARAAEVRAAWSVRRWNEDDLESEIDSMASSLHAFEP